MYFTADTLSVDSDEGQFVLYVDTNEGVGLTIDIHGIDLDAFYDQVKSRLGPYLREAAEARTAVAAGVSLSAFLCAPEDIDESGGYDLSNPKHERFHSVHADLYDNREGK